MTEHEICWHAKYLLVTHACFRLVAEEVSYLILYMKHCYQLRRSFIKMILISIFYPWFWRPVTSRNSFPKKESWFPIELRQLSDPRKRNSQFQSILIAFKGVKCAMIEFEAFSLPGFESQLTNLASDMTIHSTSTAIDRSCFEGFTISSVSHVFQWSDWNIPKKFVWALHTDYWIADA